MKNIKIGSNVKERLMFGELLEGIVVNIEIWDGPLSLQNHGTISVKVTKENKDYKIGYIEHYPIYNWYKILEVL